MQSEKISFKNSEGNSLSARVDYPAEKKPHSYAIFAHCFTCNKNLPAVNNISRGLTQAGFAVLRFDFTGLGESEGDFADTNFTSNTSDLVSAAEYLSSTAVTPSLLVGHSLGGAAVLQAAGRISSVKAVATIGAPADPQHVAHLLSDRKEKIENKGAAEVNIAGRGFTIKKQFLDDLEQSNMQQHISELKKALLIFHSPVDNIVGIDNAADIFTAAKHPKSFVSLEDADHLLSRSADSLYIAGVLSAWATRYLDMSEEPAFDSHREVAVRTGESGFTTEVKAGSHHLIADEPVRVGGQNLGPSPYEYLSSALGACTSMTLRMYADRKKWPLDSVSVHLNHKKIHAEDSGECEQSNPSLDLISREIELEGELSDEQRQKLLEIADKCPVHKTLHAGVKVESKLL